MPLQTSGPISLSNVGSEFQNSAPYSMSEFYGAAAGIPTGGAIRLGNFYGATAGKIDYITIPASQTGTYFKGDSKNTGPEYFINVGAIPYHTNAPTELRADSLVNTIYSPYAAALGYSSIFVAIRPAYTFITSGSTSVFVGLTNHAPNTGIDLRYIDDGLFYRAETLAGTDLVKNVKVTKLGATLNCIYCDNTTKLKGTVPTSTDGQSDTPRWRSSTTALYDANMDWPLEWATGPQDYAVEIEWV